MGSIYGITYILGIISFFANLAGSFIGFTKMLNVFNFKSENLVLIRTLSEFIGYLGCILLNILGRRVGSYRNILFIGYVPVTILKLLLIISFIPGFRGASHLFVICDMLDILLYATRGTTQDALLANYIHNSDDLSLNLHRQKSFSLLGSFAGICVFYCIWKLLYYMGIKSYISFMILAGVGFLSSLFSVLFLYKYLPITSTTNNLSVSKPTKMSGDIFLNKALILNLLGVICFIIGKPRMIVLITYFGKYFPRVGKNKVLVKIVFQMICYAFGFLSTSIIPKKYSKSPKVLYFLIIMLSVFHIILLQGLVINKYVLLGLYILISMIYGVTRGVNNSIIKARFVQKAEKFGIHNSERVISSVNTVMALGSIILSAMIFSGLKLNKILFYGTISNLIGLILFVF